MMPEPEASSSRGDGVRPALSGAIAIPLALAAALIGYALQRNNGVYEHNARNALVIGMAAALVAVIGSSVTRWRRPATSSSWLSRVRSSRLLVAVAAIALAYDVYALVTSVPGWSASDSPNLSLFRAGVCVGAALAATALFERPPLGPLHVPLLLAVHALLGIWTIRALPAPPIDVYYFHIEAFRALAAGRSPYSITIPLLYGSDASFYYGEGLFEGGRVHVGHPYPPLSLLLTLAGHAAGDYRYALVAAVVAASALLAYARPGRSGRLAAVLLLFTPRIFLVYGQGWTEPFVVLATAAIAFCAARKPRWLPAALGALLAVKQYTLLALPLLPLLVPLRAEDDRPGLATTVCVACGLAAVVTLPFLLWDPRGFLDAVVLFQVRQPFRPDSLSLLHGVAQHAHVATSSTVSLVAAVVALAVSLWLAPRTPAGFLASFAFTLLMLFGFAKQAFANYYFAVIGVMVSAISVSVCLALWPTAPRPRNRLAGPSQPDACLGGTPS